MSNLGAATVATAEGEEVNGKVEMESVAASVSEGTVKRKKTKRRKQEVVNAKENGAVEQEAASVAAAFLKGKVKCKKRRRKQEAVNAKENGAVEQEITSVAVAAAVLAPEEMPKSKKEVKANERVMTKQEATTTSVCALDETPKCKKDKAKERGMVEQGTTTSGVSEGTVKCKKTTRKKQEVVNAKENGTVEQEAASVAAAVLEGTVKCKKRRRKQGVANAKENGTVEQEAASAAPAVLEGTVKCKKTRMKQEVANAKENGTVEQDNASIAAAVLEGTVKRKKMRRKQDMVNAKENEAVEQEVASVAAAATVLAPEWMSKSKKKKVKSKERVMTEQEVTTTSVSALNETPKCKKEKAKERGMVEQGATTSGVSAMERTAKCKEKQAKERGMVEQESTTAIVPAMEETPKYTKKEKAKGMGIVEQEATAPTVLAMVGTAKCKEEKAKEMGVVEQEATTATVSEAPEYIKKEKAKGRGIVELEATAATVFALEGTLKCKKKEKENETLKHELEPSTAISALEGTGKFKIKGKMCNVTGLAKQETASAAVPTSEGTKKRKVKLKKKNKMQEQQESAQALSGLFAVDKIVASKPGNSYTNGEGVSGDADVSMDHINAEDPNCSTAKDANDKVKCESQNENTNCSEKFSSLQEGSEDRERQRKRTKRKRKRDASSRGPDISSQDGGRVAKRCLDSSMDHDLSCICASSLVQERKEKVKNIYSPWGSLIRFQRKKLLILDLNGLLADINMDKQNAHMAHAKVKGKLVFRRPYHYDFLRFCFQNFELGIWSSRKMENVSSVVDILMQDLKQYLLFCWDMSKCTFTGRNVIGDKHKPLVLKELKKLWNKEDPNLPWEQGEFSPSNTLLVDDSPYKALCNPPHTAIFPQPYSYLNQREDYSLGPGGDLRVYLERLSAADNVQVFIRDNPFGQQSITESDPNWSFYAKIVNNVERGLSMRW